MTYGKDMFGDDVLPTSTGDARLDSLSEDLATQYGQLEAACNDPVFEGTEQIEAGEIQVANEAAQDLARDIGAFPDTAEGAVERGKRR